VALNNFGIVEYTKLYRGAQPDAKGFDDLWQLGVRETMCLNGENDNALGWHGLVLARPMNALEGMDEVEKLVSDLKRSLALGRSVYVHCTHGRDRTGCIIGAYRIIECGWNFSKMEEERLLYGEKMILEVLDEPIMRVLHETAKKRGLDY
jgi:tyrosine-protein phosphatase SIW14